MKHLQLDSNSFGESRILPQSLLSGVGGEGEGPKNPSI